jgi:hypothetical protein
LLSLHRALPAPVVLPDRGRGVLLAVFSAAGWEVFWATSLVLSRAPHRYRRIRLIAR